MNGLINSSEKAIRLANVVGVALAGSDLEAYRDDLKDALAAYRESGPPCPGCCGTEPASPQSWRCPTHMLAESLARVAELEEALQRIANCDHPIITKTIARKALKKS